MQTIDKVLLMVAGALVLLAAAFVLATIFKPGFARDAYTMAGVVLGALTTMASIIIGKYVAPGERNAASNDSASKGDGQDGGT